MLESMQSSTIFSFAKVIALFDVEKVDCHYDVTACLQYSNFATHIRANCFLDAGKLPINKLATNRYSK
jgi:hypothetical protein